MGGIANVMQWHDWLVIGRFSFSHIALFYIIAKLMILCPPFITAYSITHTCTVGQYELELSPCRCYYVDVITWQHSDFMAVC